MKIKFQVLTLIRLDDTFNPCIVIPFPKGGVIKDHFTAGKEGYILVQSADNAEMETAHFHAVGLDMTTYTDSIEYVGLFKFENVVDGFDVSILPVIRIPEGGYGIASVDYIAENLNKDFHTDDPSQEFAPLTKEELYQLFSLDSPKKKEQKRRYTKKRKDDTVE